MASKSLDTHLDILLEIPGHHYLIISSIKLPTYNQVILCYLVNTEKHGRKVKTKSMKVTLLDPKTVVNEVLIYYQKANTITVSENYMRVRVIALNKQYRTLMKLTPSRRSHKPKVKLFQGKFRKVHAFLA